MTRKRLTEICPWLLPLRIRQRKFCFYLGMRLDRNRYAKKQNSRILPVEIFSDRSRMINEDSGFDIQYQYNKVHNLKLAAEKLHGYIIKPGETFSFCLAVKNADKKEPYLDGLSLVDGKIQGEYGGGLCQMSNLLYWLFLHTPMTVTERHGHGTEAIPPVDREAPSGIDATIAEGWLDLKVKNNTSHTFQLSITFDNNDLCGAIYSNDEKCYDYQIYNPVCQYLQKNDMLWQEADVARRKRSILTGKVTEEILYHNSCIITYPLPKDAVIIKKELMPADSATQ